MFYLFERWQKKLNNDQLRLSIKKRAIGVTKHYKGRIEEFDLNNEMINGDFYRSRIGYGIINEMAYMAKAGNPNKKGDSNHISFNEQQRSLSSLHYLIDCSLSTISNLVVD